MFDVKPTWRGRVLDDGAEASMIAVNGYNPTNLQRDTSDEAALLAADVLRILNLEAGRRALPDDWQTRVVEVPA